MGKMLLIDNYDSFTYNLQQYLAELGADIAVYRNDQITLEEIEGLKPSAIVISPGPGRPESAGISIEIVKELKGTCPILGVCLGHQAIGAAFGGTVDRGPYPVHGKTSLITHDSKTIYQGISNPFEATRYHSLLVKEEDLPGVFEVTARCDQGLIMGIRHREYQIEGVQFHPESILTYEGKKLLGNFLAISRG